MPDIGRLKFPMLIFVVRMVPSFVAAPEMNDFTKEELQIILLEMNISINRHKDLLKVAPSYQALKDKIESMIDNYHCNHESDGMIYTSNPPKNKCKKCGEFYR
jgi:hypothetical protein